LSDKKIQVEILWAIPASGKTFYAKEKCGIANDILCWGTPKGFPAYIDLDDIAERSKNDAYIQRISAMTNEEVFFVFLRDKLEASVDCSKRDKVVVDGLITTNDFAKKIMTAIRNQYPNAEFSIAFWKEDRDACFHNDRGRRSKNSTITIKNLPLEEPSEEILKEFGMTNKNVTKKQVVRKPDYQVWAEENGIWYDSNYDPGSKGKMKSSSWSLGGTSGGYDGSIHQISPQPQPASFAEFDDLLLKICPDMSFLRYKKLYNDCVETETKDDSDYYGGRTTDAYYVCDLEKLYNLLIEMDLIK